MNTKLDLRMVLAQRPVGLALDIDGTLSPIAPTPDEARIYPGVLSLLDQAQKYAHVAILTGRSIDDGASMVNLDSLTYIGTHGLEWSKGLPWLHPVEIIPEALNYYEPGKYLLDLVEEHLSELPGVIVQRKHIGGTIHYRLAPDPIETRQKLMSLLEQPAQQVNMNLSEGKLVVEIRVPLAVHKGRAIRKFVEQYNLNAIIFAGDDRTDLDALVEITKMRKEGLTALAIVVQHADTLPELLERADIIVQGMEGMVELLHEIVKQL